MKHKVSKKVASKKSAPSRKKTTYAISRKSYFYIVFSMVVLAVLVAGVQARQDMRQFAQSSATDSAQLSPVVGLSPTVSVLTGAPTSVPTTGPTATPLPNFCLGNSAACNPSLTPAQAVATATPGANPPANQPGIQLPTAGKSGKTPPGLINSTLVHIRNFFKFMFKFGGNAPAPVNNLPGGAIPGNPGGAQPPAGSQAGAPAPAPQQPTNPFVAFMNLLRQSFGLPPAPGTVTPNTGATQSGQPSQNNGNGQGVPGGKHNSQGNQPLVP